MRWKKKKFRVMTLIIVAILLLSFLLIATERLTNINKAAVAVFAGTVGWVLYICWGTDFVMSQHSYGYFNFLQGAVATSTAVKQYIAKSIFLPYVGKASEVVLFLLATMTIVEILYNNGCFDFITQLLKTRNSKRMLWTLVAITFFVSINLDNLTTTVMMLTIMHGIIPSRRQRMILGSAILIAATAGGTLTVIGNPENLVLWNMGAVTATDLSATLLVPCIMTCVVSVLLLQRLLPDRLDTEWIVMPYRGDDTNLNVWQRLLMLFVGLGGLWLIPTLHDVTKLSPFLGAFCVLALLWIVNEIFNRKLFNIDQMLQRRELRVMQYGVIQMMLYVMGMMFALGVVQETGALEWLWENASIYIHDSWIWGIIAGTLSTILDSFATAVSFYNLKQTCATGDIYYKIIAYCVMVGSNILAVGSMSGIALLKMERMHVGWYFRNVGWRALCGGIIGFVILIAFSII